MKKVDFWVRALVEDHETLTILGYEKPTQLKIKHSGYSVESPFFKFGKLIVARRVVFRFGEFSVEKDWAVFSPATGGWLRRLCGQTRIEALQKANNSFRNKPLAVETFIKGVAKLNSAIEWTPSNEPTNP